MQISRELSVKNVYKIHKMLKGLPRNKVRYPSLPKVFRAGKKINQRSAHFQSVTRGYLSRVQNYLNDHHNL